MNICEWVDHWAEAAADRPAIICGDRQYSYAELADSIASLATVLQNDFGITEGDRVAYLGHNNPRMLEAVFACAKMGAMLVPLNWRLAVPELVQILVDAEARLLIVGQEQIAVATAVTEQLDTCRPVHADRNPGSDPWPGLQALQEQNNAVYVDREDRSDNPVLILYTSGTTGRPKGVVLTQSALLWNAVHSVSMHDMTASDYILNELPLFHAGGVNMQVLPALYIGATVMLHETFDPGLVLESITSGMPTLTGLVPAQIKAVTGHADWAATDMGRLRSVTTGSTFVPDSCIEPWVERGVTAIQVYGTTETSAIAIHQTRANAGATKGSVGFPAMHCRIRIVDSDGQDMTAGEHGEILVSGPNLFEQYWRNPSATEDALRDGWFHTGDIGFHRADGAYVIADRKKDLIISGGENIYPAELEAVLDEHPDIVEAAVVGRSDDRWGEVPVAVVVITDDSRLDHERVHALFKDRLARFKHPQQVMLVDKLPRNAMGKVEKFQLRKLIANK